MKPFDLEKALAGRPVVTRDGRPVTELEQDSHPSFPLKGRVGYFFKAWSLEGEYDYCRGDSPFDLFMAEPEPGACPHKELKKQLVGDVFWYACTECGQKFKAEPWDGKVKVLAADDSKE